MTKLSFAFKIRLIMANNQHRQRPDEVLENAMQFLQNQERLPDAEKSEKITEQIVRVRAAIEVLETPVEGQNDTTGYQSTLIDELNAIGEQLQLLEIHDEHVIKMAINNLAETVETFVRLLDERESEGFNSLLDTSPITAASVLRDIGKSESSIAADELARGLTLLLASISEIGTIRHHGVHDDSDSLRYVAQALDSIAVAASGIKNCIVRGDTQKDFAVSIGAIPRLLDALDESIQYLQRRIERIEG